MITSIIIHDVNWQESRWSAIPEASASSTPVDGQFHRSAVGRVFAQHAKEKNILVFKRRATGVSYSEFSAVNGIAG